MDTIFHLVAATVEKPTKWERQRVVDDLKDENEQYRKMVMEAIEKIMGNLGAADVDLRLEEQLIDGILCNNIVYFLLLYSCPFYKFPPSFLLRFSFSISLLDSPLSLTSLSLSLPSATRSRKHFLFFSFIARRFTFPFTLRHRFTILLFLILSALHFPTSHFSHFSILLEIENDHSTIDIYQ